MDLTAEIFAVGKWNGMSFMPNDLEGIVKAFEKLKDIHRVPLKFGHNDEQPFTDGQPALGWVESVWVEGEKLFAKFTDIPDLVFAAMQKKLYRNVSIELDMQVNHSGSEYPLVLSGVALLGADIPAVNVLKDLTAYMARDTKPAETLTFKGKRLSFTVKEESTMPTVEELQAKLDASEAARKAAEQKAAGLETEKVTAKFAAEKDKLTAKLEGLVKAKAITPAKRDEILKQWKDDETVVGGLNFTVEAIADATKGQTKKDDGEQGKVDDKKEDDQGTPDKILLSRINEMRVKNPSLSFTAAKTAVFGADKELARAYINMTGEK